MSDGGLSDGWTSPVDNAVGNEIANRRESRARKPRRKPYAKRRARSREYHCPKSRDNRRPKSKPRIAKVHHRSMPRIHAEVARWRSMDRANSKSEFENMNVQNFMTRPSVTSSDLMRSTSMPNMVNTLTSDAANSRNLNFGGSAPLCRMTNEAEINLIRLPHGASYIADANLMKIDQNAVPVFYQGPTESTPEACITTHTACPTFPFASKRTIMYTKNSASLAEKLQCSATNSPFQPTFDWRTLPIDNIELVDVPDTPTEQIQAGDLLLQQPTQQVVLPGKAPKTIAEATSIFQEASTIASMANQAFCGTREEHSGEQLIRPTLRRRNNTLVELEDSSIVGLNPVFTSSEIAMQTIQINGGETPVLAQRIRADCSTTLLTKNGSLFLAQVARLPEGAIMDDHAYSEIKHGITFLELRPRTIQMIINTLVTSGRLPPAAVINHPKTGVHYKGTTVTLKPLEPSADNQPPEEESDGEAFASMF